MADTSLEDIENLARYKSCECCECAALCQGLPGGFTPQQVWPLLNEEFVKRTVVDNYKGPVFYIRPRTKNETGGSTAGFVKPNGGCVNLDGKGCKLVRGKMPIECVSCYGCSGEGKNRPPSVSRDALCAEWNTDEGRAVIEQYEKVATRLDPDRTPSKASYIVDLMTMALCGDDAIEAIMLGQQKIDKRVSVAKNVLHAQRCAADPNGCPCEK